MAATDLEHPGEDDREYKSAEAEFDEDFYFGQCQHLAEKPSNLFQHYLDVGWAEGKDPCIAFSTAYYVETYPGVIAAGMNPFVHFVNFGRSEGRASRESRFSRKETRVADRSDVDCEPETSQEAIAIINSGLFDHNFYIQNCPDVEDSGFDVVEHFLVNLKNKKLYTKPNFYFDPEWYLAENEDILASAINPLLHYIWAGEKEGRRPCAFFEPAWYATTYNLPPGEGVLIHYLRHRRSGDYSPIPEFDVKYYCNCYPDVTSAGIDPFEHFLLYGFKENRNPSDIFDTRFYRQRYLRAFPNVNPLLHYIENRNLGHYDTKMGDDEPTLARQVRAFTKGGNLFEEQQNLRRGRLARAMVLAFYLPQFHSFDENDKWWGKGFTEWTNVARSVPRFAGHYQPRIPRDLGFYNLNNVDSIKKQIELAEQAGIGGFVFYFYWFNRKRLLDKPLQLFINQKNITFPFCLMWANENWSRRWDGSESDVMISQNYDEEDDIALIQTFANYFKCKNYIRLDGRPLLMIYRVSEIPQAKERISKWRSLFEKNHKENPILVMAQTFGDYDPTVYDLDGAVEFPPHGTEQACSQINSTLEFFDADAKASVISYDDVVTQSISGPRPPYPLIKTLVPSWDNDARRQGLAGLVVHGSNPMKYQQWLDALIIQADENKFFNRRLICLNAWNEWGEGAYLEPDLHFGAAYLNSTARALYSQPFIEPRMKIVLIGHDAFRSGAQTLLYEISRLLVQVYNADVEVILLSGGELLNDYKKEFSTSVCDTASALESKVAELSRKGFEKALVNSAVSAYTGHTLKRYGFRFLLLIHELPGMLKSSGHAEHAGESARLADKVLFADEVVRDGFEQTCGAGRVNSLIRPQGNYKRTRFNQDSRVSVRTSLGVSLDACIVLCIGYADLRKGFDLFLQAWQNSYRAKRNEHFVWLGDMHPWISSELEDQIKKARSTGTFHLLGYHSNVADYLSAADVFLLTSRQDPFPTVVLEALAVGLPVVAFEGSGGIPNMLRRLQVGEVVPFGDVSAIGHVLPGLAKKYRIQENRDSISTVAAAEFGFDAYVGDLVGLLNHNVLKISVVVLSYNYAHYLRERIGSILSQTYPVYEIIVLDDASTDSSLDVIQELAAEAERDIRIVANPRNSGSVFKQWAKAAGMARGDFIWLAEADDSSDPDFLSHLASLISSNDDVNLAFSDSKAVDGDGRLVWPDYKDYYSEIENGALCEDEIFDGPEFLSRFMSVRNHILNVSAMIWRKETLLEALQVCEQDLKNFRMAGDWRLYIEALNMGGRIAYSGDPLNIHRRHSASVTHSLAAKPHVEEITRIHSIVTRLTNGGDDLRSKQSSYITVLEGSGNSLLKSSEL